MVKVLYGPDDNGTDRYYYLSYRKIYLNQIEIHLDRPGTPESWRIAGLAPGDVYADTVKGIYVVAVGPDAEGGPFTVEVTRDAPD